MVFSQESFRSQLDRASSSSLIDKSQYSDRSTPAARQRHYISLAKWIITYIFTFLIAFTIGKWSNIRPSSLSVPMVSQTFKYNRSFSYPPSNHTDAAWETLYPKFGTFFTHTPEAPYRSTLSVFHQLHCLDGIRHGYWQAMDAAFAGHQLFEKDIPMMSSPSHVRHCIDLLRQSLMCNADSTVEVKDDKGGVLGFGTIHNCIDWNVLISKIDSWNSPT